MKMQRISFSKLGNLYIREIRFNQHIATGLLSLTTSDQLMVTAQWVTAKSQLALPSSALISIHLLKANCPTQSTHSISKYITNFGYSFSAKFSLKGLLK